MKLSSGEGSEALGLVAWGASVISISGGFGEPAGDELTY